MIQGETGTGKELAARALHYFSRRRDFAFVPVNCGALPDTLLESELFGHERGAFTDARGSHRGLVASAQGGTLFLDEVEALSPRAQVVLLRFLQNQEYRPVGATALKLGDARVVAASNVNLHELAKRQLFRSDLLFRFGVLNITMPPLRKREDDAVMLARPFPGHVLPAVSPTADASDRGRRRALTNRELAGQRARIAEFDLE